MLMDFNQVHLVMPFLFWSMELVPVITILNIFGLLWESAMLGILYMPLSTSLLITAYQSRTSQFRFVRFSSEPQDVTCFLSLVLVQYRINLVGSNLFLFCLLFFFPLVFNYILVVMHS